MSNTIELSENVTLTTFAGEKEQMVLLSGGIMLDKHGVWQHKGLKLGKEEAASLGNALLNWSEL